MFLAGRHRRLQRRDVGDVMMKAFQALRPLVPVGHQQHGDTEGVPDFEVVILLVRLLVR